MYNVESPRNIKSKVPNCQKCYNILKVDFLKVWNSFEGKGIFFGGKF
jgi:hypothetical protein